MKLIMRQYVQINISEVEQINNFFSFKFTLVEYQVGSKGANYFSHVLIYVSVHTF